MYGDIYLIERSTTNDHRHNDRRYHFHHHLEH